jgi:uncharacterized protein (UPF0332 family)
MAEKFVERLKDANPGRMIDLILIGSVARGKETSRSDVDILAIADNRIHNPGTDDPIHLQIVSQDNFVKRLSDADDFACWAVRYGVPLVETAFWREIARSHSKAVWPSWQKKVSHAANRLVIAARLLEIGDLAAAAEETLYAASHAARAVLLRDQIFPLSRPEMVDQLHSAKQLLLSQLLSALVSDIYSTDALYRGHGLLKKLLIGLDRTTYRHTVLRTKKPRKQTLSALRDAPPVHD